MKTIEHYWKTTLNQFSKETELIERLWKDVHTAYSSTTRHYHNLDHIYTMLVLADHYKLQLKQYYILNLAIFYHDIIYDVSQHDNEQKSWEFAEEHLLPLHLPKPDIEQLKICILATKKHQHHSQKDINYLLDFDLYTLGQSWENYRHYMQQIRAEYAIYPEDLYTTGRIQVLEHLLLAGSLYKTPEFIDRYEKQAKENLNREINLLREKIKA